MPRAGSEFTGLTRLGVVVEELGSQATGCGLTREMLEGAVAKTFGDAGVKTATNSDEDTYVHVTLMTSTLPNGMCISRYDWSIYSMTEATLSYQRTPQLTQVLLAHKGGLTGQHAGGSLGRRRPRHQRRPDADCRDHPRRQPIGELGHGGRRTHNATARTCEARTHATA